MIQAATLSEALELEVDTFKHDEEADLKVAVLSLDDKATLMNLVTSKVSKAWDNALNTI